MAKQVASSAKKIVAAGGLVLGLGCVGLFANPGIAAVGELSNGL